jgi:hypothetical protein
MATTSCIYRILNIENKKFYIGSAADYGRRKKQHIWYLNNGKNNPMHGISLIDKWKEKYGEEEASKMWILSNRKRSKMIIQKNKNGDFIEEFISMTEASLRTGINISLISKSCKGEKIKAGGYNWEYKELNNN